MRRREFVTFVSGVAVTWPLAGRAGVNAPVVGYLNGGSPGGTYASFLAAFREGLGETGYVEGTNVAIEYLSVPKTSAGLIW